MIFADLEEGKNFFRTHAIHTAMAKIPPIL